MNRKNWKHLSINECADVIGGGTPSTKNSDYWDGNISWISPKDLSNHQDKYITKGERSITELGLEKSSAKLLPANSLLFSSRAPIGYLAINTKPVATNQGFKSLILKEEFDVEFFYYLFKDKTEYIKNLASGSTFQEVSGSVVKNLSFLIPPKQEQKRISNILSKLDKKIELNLKMNESLEEIAKTLFKSWFIDFDPVRAKAEGRPTGLSKEISDLFPDSFEDSELDEIPRGWTVTHLDDIADFQNGYAFSSKEYEFPTQDSKEVFRMGYIKIGGGFKEDNTPVFVPISSKGNQQKYVLYKDDLTISMTDVKNNMQILGCCALIEEDERFLLNQRVGRIRVKECVHICPYYLYIYMNDPKNIDLLRSRSNSGVQVNLSTSTIKETNIILPTKKLSQYFSDIVRPIYSKIFHNNVESKNLEEIRDIFLPKLISGELQIPDAENLIEEAGI